MLSPWVITGRPSSMSGATPFTAITSLAFTWPDGTRSHSLLLSPMLEPVGAWVALSRTVADIVTTLPTLSPWLTACPFTCGATPPNCRR